MRWRQAISEYVQFIGDYFLGRDGDVVVPREKLPSARGFVPGRRPSPQDAGALERARLADAVQEARRQWDAARGFFDNVTEPELIDYAVFAVGAAEKRYMFLLEEARRHGVEVDPLTMRA